jgi:hypothetical protein
MTRPNGSGQSIGNIIAMQQRYRGIRLSSPPHKLLATLQGRGFGLW